MLLSAVYLTLLALHSNEGKGGFGSLAGVAELFSNPWLLLGGWIHYLAFGLFMGAWEVQNAAGRGGISRNLCRPDRVAAILRPADN